MIPTFRGYIGSTKDALLVIQGVLSGQLSAVPRRPHDGERIDLIASGNVFVFIEERSGIKRWTDGVAWSPSRILGRFLVYRELDRQALTNSKEKGSRLTEKAKRKRKSSGDLIKDSMGNDAQRQPNRQLVGSLIASYAFKESGLIKKTMSVTVNRVDSNQRPSSEIIHLVSYYCADDVLNGVLVRPSDSPQLKDLQLAPE
ncbi:Gti1/Pac2 family protein CYBJADRAFT_130635, partial [Cyberlindnera jadinii NRRL Y-1542]